MSKFRGFCWTINNPVDQDIADVLDLQFKVSYLVVGDEVGKDGTPHLQGYCYFKGPRTFKAVKNMLPRAHIEAAKSTTKAAAYCRKDGSFYEFGEEPCQGKTSWEAIEEAMKDPKNHIQTYNQYGKAFRAIKNDDLENRDEVRRVYLIDVKQRFAVSSGMGDPRNSFMEDDINVYNGQPFMFLKCYAHTCFNIENWIYGHVTHIKRGYELIPVNPIVLYLMYSCEAEYRYLKSTYIDILDDDAEEKVFEEEKNRAEAAYDLTEEIFC